MKLSTHSSRLFVVTWFPDGNKTVSFTPLSQGQAENTFQLGVAIAHRVTAKIVQKCLLNRSTNLLVARKCKLWGFFCRYMNLFGKYIDSSTKLFKCNKEFMMGMTSFELVSVVQNFMFHLLVVKGYSLKDGKWICLKLVCANSFLLNNLLFILNLGVYSLL